jgi:putative two-component system response regulator
VSNIAQFRALVRKINQASHPDVKLALRRVAGDSKEKLRDASLTTADFFDSLRQCLSQLKGHANADVRTNCLYDCARYFYTSGNPLKAISSAREGLALARAARLDTQARKGLTFLGSALADWGAIGEAIECQVNAIELAKALQDSDGAAISTHNLGVALIYASQYQDAIACFDLADGIVESADFARSIRAAALGNKAVCYLRLDNITEGLACARQSIAETGEPSSGPETLSRIVREGSLVQLLLEAGELNLAASRVPIIKSYSQTIACQKTSVIGAISEGLVEIHRGDASRGIDLLCKAKQEAHGVDSLTQDALLALVRGYDVLGQHQKALEHLQQLIERFVATRQESALLNLHSVVGIKRSEAQYSKDLSALKHREALLRAKVAEEQLAWSQIEMLERLAVTADLREEDTGEHGYRVGRLSALLAEDLGMDADTCLAVDLAARLHDIGKMGIPDRILLTSKELKEAERHFMCQHTIIGAELLAKSNIPQLRLAEAIALYHHEWWDGSGYPKELAGKRIPVHARIVALADMFDALTHGRPYAQLWEMDRALAEIVKRRGTQFDPELTDRFVNLVARLRKAHPNLDEFLARAGQNSPFLQARRKIKVMLEEERAHERRNALPGNATRH